MSTTASIAVAVIAMAMTGSIYLFGNLDGDGEKSSGSKTAESRRWVQKVHNIDAFQLYDVIKTPKEPKFMGEANDAGVTWALFFHKPYCGACRRVRPVFEALASRVEETTRLRFGAIDCVKYRIFCDKEGMDTQPRIVLYSMGNSGSRKHVGTWKGMLMAWEIAQWFKGQQYQNRIHKSVKWPSDVELAKGVLDYKAKGMSHVETVAKDAGKINRTGYFVDIKSALYQGLVDAVFKGQDELSGARLRVLLKWLTVVGKAYPEPTIRQRVMLLHDEIKIKKTWTQDDYEKKIEAWTGVEEITDDDWEWCKIKGPGIGGYPCGLWTLFHVLQANTNRIESSDTLKTIHAWVTTFFGCTECAQHFNELFVSDKGDSQGSDMDCGLWLWNAHNKVRARLYKDDDTTTGKLQWPSVKQCEECYEETARNGTSKFTDTEYYQDQWREGFVFQYLQEIFCYESDSLPCASFWDPSDDGIEKDNTWKYIGMGVACVALLVLAAYCVCFNDEEDEEDVAEKRLRMAEMHQRMYEEERNNGNPSSSEDDEGDSDGDGDGDGNGDVDKDPQYDDSDLFPEDKND